MAAHSELQMLKEEERVLNKVRHQFKDQLNRLEVEELALLSQISNQNFVQDSYTAPETPTKVFQTENAKPLLDLEVFQHHIAFNEDDDEEEDEEEDGSEDLRETNDELTFFVKRLEASQDANNHS